MSKGNKAKNSKASFSLLGHVITENYCSAAEVVDNREELETSLPTEAKVVLVYIAGYATRRDKELAEEVLVVVF